MHHVRAKCRGGLGIDYSSRRQSMQNVMFISYINLSSRVTTCLPAMTMFSSHSIVRLGVILSLIDPV
jgi:hypothetical protein